MVFAPPGVQESTETRKEIAPGKHMPKKYENLGAESKKHENGRSKSGCQALGNSLFSDLDAFWPHFGPKVVSRPHLDPKMMRKWTPKDPKDPKIKKKC